MVPRGYTAFSSNETMVTVLHRALERKVVKVKQMKLEVMWPKTKNNMNFQVSCLGRIRMEGRGWGKRGLIREGGAYLRGEGA